MESHRKSLKRNLEIVKNVLHYPSLSLSLIFTSISISLSVYCSYSIYFSVFLTHNSVNLSSSAFFFYLLMWDSNPRPFHSFLGSTNATHIFFLFLSHSLFLSSSSNQSSFLVKEGSYMILQQKSLINRK